jgi:hypothetical protein
VKSTTLRHTLVIATIAGLAMACSATLLAAPNAKAASPVEASRYVNAQGVEILVSRGAPKAAEPPNTEARDDTAPATTPAPAPGRSDAKAGAATALARSEHRVSPGQQAARDDERQRILTQELLDEQQQLDVKRRALRNPRAASDLSEIEWRKLNEGVERHESNIKSLHRELGMLRPAPARASDQTPTTVLR